MQVSSNNLYIWIFYNFLSSILFSLKTYCERADVSKLYISHFRDKLQFTKIWKKKSWWKEILSSPRWFFKICFAITQTWDILKKETLWPVSRRVRNTETLDVFPNFMRVLYFKMWIRHRLTYSVRKKCFVFRETINIETSNSLKGCFAVPGRVSMKHFF